MSPEWLTAKTVPRSMTGSPRTSESAESESARNAPESESPQETRPDSARSAKISPEENEATTALPSTAGL
jgi:hypothetical protein